MNYNKIEQIKSQTKVAVRETATSQYMVKAFMFLSVIALVAFLLSPWQLVSARGTPDNFVDLAEKLAPSVVNISSTQAVPQETEGRAMPELAPGSPFQEFFEQFNDRRRDQIPETPRVSMGSGFFISKDGYLVTNNHVIADASEVNVTTTDGEEYVAEIVGRDTDLDIALLKIESDEDFVPLEFSNSDDIRVGEWVLSIGNPFGLGGSVTAGIVSARHRRIRAGPYDDFIQTDASINRGNSGGPLFDMDGKVIGVNTMIFTPNGGNIGIGFSIPSNDVERTVAHLLEFGRPIRGWIGVSIRDITEDMADGLGYEGTEGAVVGDVTEGGPADIAGILPLDVIKYFNGEHVKEVNDLPRIVANTAIEKEVDVKIWRDGKEMTLTLITGEKGATEETAEVDVEAEAEEKPSSDEILGMRISPLNDALREQFKVPSDIEGLLVSNLARSSNAAQSGIRPGDVIAQVNQRDVVEVEELEDIIKRAVDAERKAIVIRIYRGGGYYIVPVKLPVEDDDED
jgi:serine protease Do